MTDTLKAIEQLEDLHHLIADCRKGYQDAANKARNHTVAGYLIQLSEEREAMRVVLAAMVERSTEAGEGLRNVTAEGHLFPTWIDIRIALSLAPDDVLLEECERGENYLLASYSEAIEAQLQPPAIQRVLIQQRVIMQDSLLALQRTNKTMAWASLQR